MSSCPVVKIKFDNDQGYCLLNKSDFDETKHELFTDSAAEDAKAAEKPKPSKPAWAAKKTAS